MIHIIIGTKAQLIKMAPVMRSLLDSGVRYNFIHTGQHHETISDILDDFELPDVDFYIQKSTDVTRKTQVPKWLALCEKKTRKSSTCWRGKTGPNDVVVVHGDTLSTMIGALAAKRAGMRCAHVESGLRSWNRLNPFPEELIRILTFRLADILFCPDETAFKNVQHLKKEVINTFGNTMIDATRFASKTSANTLRDSFGVVSLHRYENIFNESRLSWLINKLIEISSHNRLVFVMHPPTEERLRKTGLLNKIEKCPNIETTPRMGYLNFVRLLSGAEFLITDGGSNQEESSYLGVPCLVMRKATERLEGIGENVVVSNYDDEIIANFFENLESLRRQPNLPKASPSETIVGYLAAFQE